MPEKPRTQREMIYQLWFAVIGSNGDGLAAQVRDIKAWMATHPRSCAYLERKSSRLRRIVEFVGIAAGGAAVATLAGKVLKLW